jgi:hypothetical protein
VLHWLRESQKQELKGVSMLPMIQILGLYFYLTLLFMIGGAIYLLLRGRLKFFMVWIAIMILVMGHLALKYVRSTDPQILPQILEQYAEWFFK